MHNEKVWIMKPVIRIAAVLGIMLFSLVSCREELFELVGDHDIKVIYSNNPVFSNAPPMDWTRELTGEAELGLCAAPTDFYFRITNISLREVTLTGAGVPPYIVSVEGDGFSFSGSIPPFSLLPGSSVNCTITFTPFGGKSEGTMLIPYRPSGDDERYFFSDIRAEGP